METTNATNEMTKGRIREPLADHPMAQEQARRVVLRESLRHSFDRLVARTWVPLQTLAMRARLSMPRLSHIALAPSEDQLDVHVDLPGVEPTDLEVAIQGSTMTIRGARHRQRELRSKNYYRLERYREVFQRAIPMGFPVDPDKVTATLKHGVLQVRLPKGKGGNGQVATQIAVRAA